MPVRIGLLLPRSTDYPSMGFDMLDGLRSHLQILGITDPVLVTENIGYGDDHALSYARAEKLLLQDDVQLMIAYSNVQNAEQLYQIAQSSGRPFLFLDSGMQMPREDKIPGNWFLSLQGLDACRRLGRLSAEGEKKVLMATSFFDAGFRGTYFACKGLEEAKGSVCGNYISKHKISEFSIDPYLELINKGAPETVMANFSIYLGELFFNALAAAGEKATPLPFFCSPFMAEEQFLAKSNFPGGTFHTLVPWALSLENEAQQLFVKTIREQKNKTANIFHLLGWEAALASVRLLNEGPLSLADWSFESPRGTVTFHPKTQISYAPLYKGMIVSGNDGKCALRIDQKQDVTAEEHAMNSAEKEDGNYSGWKNNYFCS